MQQLRDFAVFDERDFGKPDLMKMCVMGAVMLAWGGLVRGRLIAAIAITLAGLVLTLQSAVADSGVVVSIKPLQSLVAAVMAPVASTSTKGGTSRKGSASANGRHSPYLLIRNAGTPHSTSLRPSDVEALNHAMVLFQIAPTLEASLTKLSRSLPRSVRVVMMQDSRSLILHQVRSGGVFKQHQHGRIGDGHRDESHGRNIDPHIWLDPVNGKLMVAKIAAELSELYPAHAARYRDNAAIVILKLEALQAELKAILVPVADKPYIVFHDAYQYFEKRFGLRPIGSVTLGAEHQPGARRIVQLRKQLQQTGAACVFAEPQFRPRLTRVIVEGSSAKLGILDPIGAALPPGPELYFTLLRNMAASLRHCLQ